MDSCKFKVIIKNSKEEKVHEIDLYDDISVNDRIIL